jgi:hypothetical protein
MQPDSWQRRRGFLDNDSGLEFGEFGAEATVDA